MDLIHNNLLIISRYATLRHSPLVYFSSHLATEQAGLNENFTMTNLTEAEKQKIIDSGSLRMNVSSQYL